MARKVENKKEKRQIIPTLIGAGITERWYFTHLKNLMDLKVQIRPRFFGNEHIHMLEKNVEIVLASEGLPIVVFDVDVMQWDEGERLRLEKFRKKYARDKRVLLCESMPSIEYWFLLHYVATNKHLGTSKNAMDELKKHMAQFEKTERFLHNPKWVTDIGADGRLQLAMQRAEKFARTGQSFTDVWQVLKALLSPNESI